MIKNIRIQKEKNPLKKKEKWYRLLHFKHLKKKLFLKFSINIRLIGFKNNNNLIIILINKFVDKIHKQE